MIDEKETQRTRERYQRIAKIYDLMETMPEKRFTPWRKQLWSQVKGPRVLEVGVPVKIWITTPQGLKSPGLILHQGCWIKPEKKLPA